MAGKGDKRRPREVDEKTFENNWDRIFKKKKETSNNNGNDEIQYGTNKTKYVTLKLKGDSVDYKVSLTKRK